MVGARLQFRLRLYRVRLYVAHLCQLQLAALAGLYGRSVEARGGRAQHAVSRVVHAKSPTTVSYFFITSFSPSAN
jgi:hypothetical protein